MGDPLKDATDPGSNESAVQINLPLPERPRRSELRSQLRIQKPHRFRARHTQRVAKGY
jgi:hypothetical protein